MDNIKDIINQVIGQIAEKQPNNQSKLERIWLNVLEAKELEHTRLVGLKNGWISAYVDSPAWLYQMKIRRGKIVERLKQEIPEIKNISFKIGKVK